MKKLTFGLVALAFVLGAASTIASTSFAFRGDPNIQGPNFDPEHHQAIVEALENSDYNAWSELMANKGRITEFINENNFAQFVQMHKLMKSGDFEEAEAIREELGLGPIRDGSGPGRHSNRVCLQWADEE